MASTVTLHTGSELTLWSRLDRRLLAPSQALEGVADQRGARLLASFLLVVTAVFLCIDAAYVAIVPSYSPPWLGYMVLLVAYALARTRLFRVGAALFLALFPVVIFALVLNDGAPDPPMTMAFLVLGPLAGAFFVPILGVALLGVINLAAILALWLLVPEQFGQTAVVGPLAINALGSVLAVAFMAHRARIEAARAEQLQTSEQRLRLAMEAAHMGVWQWDFAADQMWFSPEVIAFLGLDPARSEGCSSEYLALVHPDDRQQLGAEMDFVLAGEPRRVQAHRVVRPDGGICWVQLHGQVEFADGRPRWVTGVVADVTEIKQLEQQLGQAQKLEAVGQLAGGIAHDFNNLLTVILGNVEFLDDVARPELEEIAKAANSAARLTQQLLAFSRRVVLRPTVVDLDTIIRETHQMIARLIGADIETEFVPHGALHFARVDAAQIQQILLNLASNARDAMPRGGKLTIATDNRSFSEHAPTGVEPGDYVMISVTDTGEGMDEQVRAKIFEPFFTTKEIGKGTGLGLSMVFGIVTQSGGAIEVVSAAGEGTTFKLYFPRASAELSPSAEQSDPRLSAGKEQVLLVEDELTVRMLCDATLARAGYRVIAASRASEAEVVLRSDAEIDLLVTDLVMPGGGGEQLAQRARELRPGLKVLYMTGYVAEQRSAALDGPLLNKPFRPHDLSAAVREILDA